MHCDDLDDGYLSDNNESRDDGQESGQSRGRKLDCAASLVSAGAGGGGGLTSDGVRGSNGTSGGSGGVETGVFVGVVPGLLLSELVRVQLKLGGRALAHAHAGLCHKLAGVVRARLEGVG